MQKYIIYDGYDIWHTNWFNQENHYQEGMIVIDIYTGKWLNGKKWQDIEEDYL